MELKHALALAETKREIIEAPGQKQEFEELSPQDKLLQLGNRMLAIGSTLTNDPNVYFIGFSFQTEEGTHYSLELAAEFAYECGSAGELDLQSLSSVRALWTAEDGISLMDEQVKKVDLASHDPDEVTNALSRLEESVSEAERFVKEIERRDALGATSLTKEEVHG